jgi:hypothetical protein
MATLLLHRKPLQGLENLVALALNLSQIRQ